MSTGIPLALPVKPNEAASLAELIFRLSGDSPWQPALREKLRSALPALGLEYLAVKTHTLAPDPVHTSTFYILVQNERGEPWILHLASASAPESSLFAKPVLIARVRPAGGREVIVNAIPAAPHLRELIESLLPHLRARATSVHNLWSIPAGSHEIEFFQSLPKRPNLLPALRAHRPTWDPYLALLLSNWREGFVFILEDLRRAPSEEDAQPFSRFSFVVESLSDPRPLAEELHLLRSRLSHGVDVELNFAPLEGVQANELLGYTNNLKLLGASIQSLELPRNFDWRQLPESLPWGLTLPCAEPESQPATGRIHWKISAPEG
jgi:hypothetical protein